MTRLVGLFSLLVASSAAAQNEDGRALCNEGWRQFLAGEHEAAAATLRRGTTALGTSSGGPSDAGGACEYSLGRAEEALGHLEEAEARYRWSLHLRFDYVVLDRLASLSGGSVATDGDFGEPPPGPRDLTRAVPSARGARVVASATDGRIQVLVLLLPRQRFGIAARYRGAPWELEPLDRLTDDVVQDLAVEIAPPPAGGDAPTVVLTHQWGGDRFGTGDDFGYTPDLRETYLYWHDGSSWTLARLGVGALRRYQPPGDEPPRVSIEEGLFRVGGDCRASPRIAALCGLHPREDWLETPAAGARSTTASPGH